MRVMKQMVSESNYSVTEFIFMGLTVQREFQLPLFVLFLLNYTATVVGNLSLMNLICLNSHLHTPMYFFLQHLAFVDLCYTSAITPKMLKNFTETKASISFIGCMLQLLAYGTFATIDSFILAAMARYSWGPGFNL